jgi:hypothetical protein
MAERDGPVGLECSAVAEVDEDLDAGRDGPGAAASALYLEDFSAGFMINFSTIKRGSLVRR